MTHPGNPPSDSDVAKWVGDEAYEYWNRIERLIEEDYPNIFMSEWLFGGKKHGWSFRYKKNKSFCTFIPEKNRFALLIVFGAEERDKVMAIKDNLSVQTQRNVMVTGPDPRCSERILSIKLPRYALHSAEPRDC